MKLRLFLLLVLPCWLAQAKAIPRCGICGIQNAPQMFAVKGWSNAGEKIVCGKCMDEAARCSICRLHVPKDGFTQLEDGRRLCHADFNAGIFDVREAERILHETKRELNRVFWKYMTFPETNLEVAVVDAKELHRLARRPYNPATVKIQGLTQTLFRQGKSDGKAEGKSEFKHKIYLLSGLPKPRLMATCAHEFGHVWLHENLKPTRKIEENTVEGFCELIAYQLMDSLSEGFEKSVIEANAYSGDQAVTLIETERQHGFYRILQWMQHGADRQISLADLDRIRALEPELPPRASQPAYAVAVPVAAPTTLMLKGLSGVGQRRLALINNKTLALNERAKVKLGETNVTVRCLEIRDRSVVVEVDGKEQKELFLPEATK